ncbi:MAG: asparagine synthase (glutamine-hydrolyzing) [Chthoniobacterales bacterium]
MCGIAGILHFDPNRPVDRKTLQGMTDALTHRGPDGEGFYLDRNLGLGHRRLAVIDLSTGDQPMFRRGKDLVIILNGEIYNYVELREELKALGHTFSTSSDTEVILAAYEQWGFDCQKKLNGMWAFALWDARQRQLLLSRDRIGEKPLHYAARDNSLLFGSEIKSLLASGLEYKPADHLWDIYLSFGYIPAPHTFYRDIFKVMPGHCLVVRDGKVEDRAYWDLPEFDEREMRADVGGILEEFEQCFADSVKIRMRCDVPFGAFLSGGLDSASVVAAMADESSSPVETFTIGFAEKPFDERALARQVAEKFHTSHHERVAEHDSFDQSLREVAAHFDEPFGDASAAPVGLVSRLAREKVTVALTGDGGDEVLAGYPSYLLEKLAGRYSGVPKVVQRGLAGAATAASSLTRNSLRYRFNRLERVLNSASLSFEERLIAKLAPVERGLIRELVPSDIPQLTTREFVDDLLRKCPFQDPFYRLTYFNLKCSLPDQMLAKVDRMSMAHSLETRVPFLDHRLVELTYRVDKKIKLPGTQQKRLLRETYGKRLPAALLRGEKKSFRVPLREWFKKREFEEKLKELRSADFGLDRSVIGKIVRANNSGEQDHGDFIWRLLVAQRSLRRAASLAIDQRARVAA